MDELKNIAPELSKLKKENPFGVPDHYFDDFSARLQFKLEAEKVAISKPKRSIIQFLKPALGLAASFALIFMLVYWPLKTFMPAEIAQNSSGSEITKTEFLSIIEGIDENSFYALLEDQNTTDDFTDDDLISYLSSNFSEFEIYEKTKN